MKRFSIKYLMIISFSSIILACSCLLLNITFKYFENFVFNEILNNKSKELSNLVEIINLKINNLYSISSVIINDKEIKNIINKNNYSLSTQIENSKLCTELLVNYSFLNEYISSINIYIKNYQLQNDYYSNSPVEYSFKYGLEPYDIYEQFLLDENLYAYTDTFYINYVPSSSSPFPVIMTLEEINNPDYHIQAVLGISINSAYLFKDLTSSSLYKDDLFIIDGEGTSIYHSPINTSYTCTNDQTNLINAISDQSGWTYTFIDQEKNILCYKKLDKIDWYAINVIPYDSLLNSFHQTKHFLVFIAICIIMITIILCIILSNLITTPITQIISKFKKVKNGNLAIHASPSHFSEINALNTSFNAMVFKINTLLEEINKSHQIQRESELKALQAQINPHFLYNTLDAIYWMSDNEEVADIIQNLAQLFRLSLSKGQDEILILQELNQVRSYININLIRFKDKFTYIEEIDESSLNGVTIKLLLQPLVENCILHGLKYTKSDGVIKLTVQHNNHLVTFSVEDNGTGVDEHLMDGVMNTTLTNKSYGLRNIQERLWTRYGYSFTLYFKNKPDGGCIVTFSIPFEERCVNL